MQPLGNLLLHYRNEFIAWLSGTFGLTIFPEDVYLLGSLPAQVVPADVAVICTGSFVICALAALVPAYFAARLDPAKALRNE